MKEKNRITITDKKDDLDFEAIKGLLKQTYWANNRSEETIRESIENSLCFGIYLADNKRQVAFARVITDYATTFYICDVIVDEAFRGNGIGKKLIHTITTDKRFLNLKGFLLTKDAHGLYEQYGFIKDGVASMIKTPN